MFTLRTTIAQGADTVDIVNATRDRLDLMFGAGDYYLTVKPVVKGVNLVFVLDSSPSVAAERDVIAANLASLQRQIQERIRVTGNELVTTQIFILPSSNAQCDPFEALGLPNTQCEQLTEYSLYTRLRAQGWQLPSFGAGSHEAWLGGEHYASTSAFAASDWAAGSALASVRYREDAYLQYSTNINLIFPLSDELSTTSKADACFAKGRISEWYVCQLCDGACPAARALNATEQAASVVAGSGSVVFPIYSANCDYAYEPGANQFSRSDSAYVRSFLDNGQPLGDYPQDSWCAQQVCGGCNVDASGGVCFHDNCQQTLLQHMELLANRTGGRVFNINAPEEIPDNVLDAFEYLTTAYRFEIGWQDEHRDRFVYEKIVTLPNGRLGRIVLWIYTTPQLRCRDDAPCVAPNGCPGTRACEGWNLSDTCAQDDLACAGAPCAAPELCLAENECVGTRACEDGVLDPVCRKVNPLCEAPCIDACPAEGAVQCTDIRQGSETDALFVCVRNARECLAWQPLRQCALPCQSPTKCGEDPACQLDCDLDGACTQACSQSALCGFDPDCPFRCRADCRSNGACNVYCGPMRQGCPLDPDCPACQPGPSDACPDGNPGCCPAGEQWMWGKRRTHWAPLTGDEARICYGAWSTEPIPFGRCCPNPSACVVLTGRQPTCIDPGETLANYVYPGEALCGEDGTVVWCRESAGCDPANPQGECARPQTINGVAYRCDYASGTWEAA
jgi:hypothetical protein